MNEIEIQNPLIYCDMPDPDIIRVENIYYMASTTMHFMPGCIILKSTDLADWKIAGHVYDSLEDYPDARLENKKNIYGSGMWAPCLRYAQGIFYVLFASNDTHRTYLYTAEKIEGPWQKKEVKGFYHDASLLFDDDGKKYIVYGNKNIWLTELENDLGGPKKNGLNKIILQDEKDIPLGYEGSHIYKINGKYYLFNIHWPKGGMRTQSCFVAEQLDGEWKGKDVLSNDMFYHKQGIAQGGIVDTPEGNWYGVLFQDRGAGGRMPVIVNVKWQNDFPEFGTGGFVSDILKIKVSGDAYENSNELNESKQSTGAAEQNAFFGNDDFDYEIPFDKNKKTDEDKAISGKNKLKDFWEWNHIPDDKNWSAENKELILRTKETVPNLMWAKNTLTQRLSGGKNFTSVTIDVSEMKDGDYAGLSAFQSCYAFAGVKKDAGKFYLVMCEKIYGSEGVKMNRNDFEEAFVTEKIAFEELNVKENKIILGMETDFRDLKDTVEFFYCLEDINCTDEIKADKENSTGTANNSWKKIGNAHRLYFLLDHFTGCRAGLFMYSTENAGGKVKFSCFKNNEV